MNGRGTKHVLTRYSSLKKKKTKGEQKQKQKHRPVSLAYAFSMQIILPVYQLL